MAINVDDNMNDNTRHRLWFYTHSFKQYEVLLKFYETGAIKKIIIIIITNN